MDGPAAAAAAQPPPPEGPSRRNIRQRSAAIGLYLVAGIFGFAAIGLLLFTPNPIPIVALLALVVGIVFGVCGHRVRRGSVTAALVAIVLLGLNVAAQVAQLAQNAWRVDLGYVLGLTFSVLLIMELFRALAEMRHG